MSQSVYIATNEATSGKRVVALGLMELAARYFQHVTFFRPVVRDRAEDDLSLQLIRERYRIDQSWSSMAGVNRSEARRLLAEDRVDELLKIILQRFKQVEERADFVVCEGTSFRGLAPGYEFELNADIANNLGCGVLPVFSARDKIVSDAVDAVSIGLEQLEARGCETVAAFVNQAPIEHAEAIRQACRALVARAGAPIFVLPYEPLLAQPTVEEIRRALDAELIDGDPKALDREVAQAIVAAMQLPHFLERMRSGSLVVTPGDRDDILLGSVAATLSRNGPSVAAVMLTGGLRPSDSVLRLVAGLAAVPILAVATDTFQTALRVSGVRAQLRPETPRKVASAVGLFEQHVDFEELGVRLRTPPVQRMTPLLFEYELIRRARSARKRIVLAEGEEPRILEAADSLRRREVVDLVLLGREEQVRGQAAALGVSLDGIAVIDPLTSPDREQFAECYAQLRKHKGINLDAARDRLLDVNYYGTMMVHLGQADGMVSGAAHTTADTIRPAFEFIKTAPGVSLVSSVFLMCLPDRVLVYGDCAVVPNPTAEQLAEIALSSVDSAARFDIQPRVAMLSYATGESGSGEDVERVRRATRWAQQRRPDLLIDGPMQYDAAIDPQVGRSKLPGSSVAGRATVFIFPDLNTGNNTYKAVQRSSGAVAIGPVLQGLRKPVNDLSRGCSVVDIVNTVAITAIQAQHSLSPSTDSAPAL